MKERLERIAREVFREEFGVEPESAEVSTTYIEMIVSARTVIRKEQLPQEIAEYLQLKGKNAVVLSLRLAYPYSGSESDSEWQQGVGITPTSWYRTKIVYIDNQRAIARLAVDLVDTHKEDNDP